MKFTSMVSYIGLICLIPLMNSCAGSGTSSPGALQPTITWVAPAAITYGTALSSTQLNATANYPGTFTYSPAAGIIPSAGTQTLSANFTSSNPSQVASATASNSITVNKATPVVSWSTPSPVSVGAALSSAQLDATASIAGSFTYSPAAGTAMNTAGTQTLGVTFTPADTADYNSATASVSLTVNGASSGTPNYSWTNVKIVAGGYITGLYFHPTDQNLMYARTDIGGAYRWGPNDSKWMPLLDFTSRADNNWAGIEALGLDPTDPNRLYLAVGEYDASWAGNGALLISDDQGATFKTVPLNFKNGSNEPGRGTGNRIAVDPNLPSMVYFGTRDAGLQISANYGSTWSQVAGLQVVTSNPDCSGNSESDGVVSVIPLPSSGTSGSATAVVYAIVAGTGTGGTSQGIYVTTNGGSSTSSWIPVAGQPSFTGATTPLAPLQAELGPNGAIYILYGDQAGPNCMTTGQLWEFTPGSNRTSGTWRQLTLPNQSDAINNSNGYGGIAVDPSHSGYLLLSTLDQYWPTGDVVYYSTDNGLTWRDVSSEKTPGLPYSVSPNLATHNDSIAPWFGPTDTLTTGNWVTALAIDPFNANHAVYGTGGMIWTTTDMSNAVPSASSVGIVDWTVGANGIEETAVENLWAPPSGPTILLSQIGDVYGFADKDLTTAPQSNLSNPAATPSSMDFEQNTPTTVVRVTDGSYGATPIGELSTDAANTWIAFASMPSGTKGGGTIAVAPDGSSMVWATEDTSSVWYSKNQGTTWKASTGIGAQSQVISDRVKPGVFYGLSNGTLTLSTDGGATFTTAQHGLPGNGLLVALPDAQGDLWLAGQGSGLYANSGSTTSLDLTTVSGVQDAYHLGFGKAAPGSASLTLFLDGQISGQWGLYRSTNGGSSWIQINDSSHQWGGIGPVCGDMRTFGTVYFGTQGGRGTIWGTSAN